MGVPANSEHDRTHTAPIAEASLPQGFFIPKNVRMSGIDEDKKKDRLTPLPERPARPRVHLGRLRDASPRSTLPQRVRRIAARPLALRAPSPRPRFCRAVH